ncbi:unnamed protein product [Ectocarpus sp. 12 AP-2014]
MHPTDRCCAFCFAASHGLWALVWGERVLESHLQGKGGVEVWLASWTRSREKIEPARQR